MGLCCRRKMPLNVRSSTPYRLVVTRTLLLPWQVELTDINDIFTVKLHLVADIWWYQFVLLAVQSVACMYMYMYMHNVHLNVVSRNYIDLDRCDGRCVLRYRGSSRQVAGCVRGRWWCGSVCHGHVPTSTERDVIAQFWTIQRQWRRHWRKQLICWWKISVDIWTFCFSLISIGIAIICWFSSASI